MNSQDPYVKRTPGAPVSLALGTMNFGKRTNAEESERIIGSALERGFRVFDTANVYNQGEAERILGRVLARHRNDVVIATKVGLGLDADGASEGLSRAAIERAIDASRARLAVDQIAICYLHAPDHATPIEETLSALFDAVRSGKIRAWGVSNYASWQIEEMGRLAMDRGLSPPVVSQVLYNLLHRQLDVEYFAFARHAGLHTTVYNALAGGLLTGRHRFGVAPEAASRFDANAMYQGRYWTRTMFERVEQLSDVAKDEGCTLVTLAYAWLASRTDVDSILVGPATIGQLDAAIEGVQHTLTSATVARIEALFREWSGTDTNYAR